MTGARYSPFDHLASALFLSRYSAGAIVTAFSGYYDTGGNQGKGRIIATAGVVATKHDWNEIDRRWLAILKRYDLPVFHMVDVAQWNGPIGRWPLVNGGRDEARRREMLGELVEAAAGVIQAFVVALVRADYEEIDKRYRLTESFGGEYTLAQASCLIKSQEWMISQYPSAKNAHQWLAVIEQGDAGQHEFREWCRRELKYKPQFLLKSDENGEQITPLALADMIAYEHHHLYTAVDAAKRAGTQPPARDQWRGLMRALRDKLPLNTPGIYEKSSLERIVQHLKIPVRRQ